MMRFHHVNLGIPVGGEGAEAAFLIDVLEYRRMAVPAEFPTAKWFEGPDGVQIHLSEDEDHRPAARAHVAVEFGPGLGDVERRLSAAGHETETFERAGLKVLFCRDPAGNRWELRDSGG